VNWVTRHHARVNGIATAWLIRRFVDPQAELIFDVRRQVAPGPAQCRARPRIDSAELPTGR
jgi:hypothetical protein